jgi:hypothetical protein
LKFRRAACPVSRVVVVRSEGFITVPGLRWLHEVGVALVVLQYDGTPIAVPFRRLLSRLLCGAHKRQQQPKLVLARLLPAV